MNLLSPRTMLRQGLPRCRRVTRVHCRPSLVARRALAALLFLGTSGILPGQAATIRSQSHTFTASGQTIPILVEGNVDAENSFSWERFGGNYATETMRSITLRNTGSTVVRNPRLVIDDRGLWWTVSETVETALKGIEGDQEKALRLWYYLSQHRYHWRSGLSFNEMSSPFSQFCTFGYSICGRGGRSAIDYFWQAGLRGNGPEELPFLRLMNGHVQGEIYLNGKAQLFDIDARRFFLDRENRQPIGGDELARDHALSRREYTDGPVFQGWSRTRKLGALFGQDDTYKPITPTPDTKPPWFPLRPSESITFSWAPAEKWVGEKPPLLSTAYLQWLPLGNPASPFLPAGQQKGFRIESGKLVSVEGHAKITLATHTPWVMVDSRLEAAVSLVARGDVALIEHSFNRKKWTQVWSFRSTEDNQLVEAKADIAPLLRTAGKHARPRRDSWVRLSVAGSPGATVSDLKLETEVSVSPKTLPSLLVGTNQVEYRSNGPTVAGRGERVEVEIEWTEQEAVLPSPPEIPLTPKDGQVWTKTYLPFTWPVTPEAESWHLMVSTRRDFAWPYRSSYDVILDNPTFQPPFRGMFSHAQTYYWRVRPRSKEGLWGPWSPTWTFCWEGPMVPLEVEWKETSDGLVISWEANPRGQDPILYHVYGSDRRGFSVLGKPDVYLLGNTAETSMRVTDASSDNSGMNRAFYRVVAIDSRGSQSTPSAFVELPRPWIYLIQDAPAKAGEPFRGRVRSLLSMGDLQLRPILSKEGDRYAFWEKEAVTFEWVAGPDWLHLDPPTGILTGTPPAGAWAPAAVEESAGAAPPGENNLTLTVAATITHPFEVPPGSPQSAVFRLHKPTTASTELQLEIAPSPESLPEVEKQGTAPHR